MPSVNRVTLVGHLGRDPEVKPTSQGKHVARLSIATEGEKKQGQEKAETDWHTVVLFGALAGQVQGFLKKGDAVMVEGKLKTRSYEQSGVKKWTTEVLTFHVAKLEKRPPRAQQQQAGAPAAAAPATQESIDEIPF